MIELPQKKKKKNVKSRAQSANKHRKQEHQGSPPIKGEPETKMILRKQEEKDLRKKKKERGKENRKKLTLFPFIVLKYFNHLLCGFGGLDLLISPVFGASFVC